MTEKEFLDDLIKEIEIGGMNSMWAMGLDKRGTYFFLELESLGLTLGKVTHLKVYLGLGKSHAKMSIQYVLNNVDCNITLSTNAYELYSLLMDEYLVANEILGELK